MAFRAFVAVPVQPAEGLVALLEEIARLRADVKPVAPGNLHFTLSFLGQVDNEARGPLGDAVRSAAAGVRAFDLALRSVGAFPNVRHPRVVWVGVADPRPMAELATRVREALARAGAPADDKDFRAHLTLARVRSDRALDELVSFLKRHGHDEPGGAHVDHVSLYRSTQGPQGPSYEALETARLEA